MLQFWGEFNIIYINVLGDDPTIFNSIMIMFLVNYMLNDIQI